MAKNDANFNLAFVVIRYIKFHAKETCYTVLCIDTRDTDQIIYRATKIHGNNVCLHKSYFVP